MISSLSKHKSKLEKFEPKVKRQRKVKSFADTENG